MNQKILKIKYSINNWVLGYDRYHNKYIIFHDDYCKRIWKINENTNEVTSMDDFK